MQDLYSSVQKLVIYIYIYVLYLCLSQLHRLFSRIRDHERLAEQGLDPAEVEKANKTGTYEEGYYGDDKATAGDNDEDIEGVERREEKKKEGHNDDEGERDAAADDEDAAEDDGDDEAVGGDEGDDILDPLDEYEFEAPPTEEEIEAARAALSPDDYLNHHVDEQDEGNDNYNSNNRIKDEDGEADEERDKDQEDSNLLIDQQISDNTEADTDSVVHDNYMSSYIPKQRQTFLYSATAICAMSTKFNHKHLKIKAKRLRHLPEALKALPLPLQELLSMIAVRDNIKIVDVTGIATTMNNKISLEKSGGSSSSQLNHINTTSISTVSLPKGLTQCEARVPSEDKDAMCYLFLLKVSYSCVSYIRHIGMYSTCSIGLYMCVFKRICSCSNIYGVTVVYIVLCYIEQGPKPDFRQQHQDRPSAGWTPKST